jgi:hypothetical protein
MNKWVKEATKTTWKAKMAPGNLPPRKIIPILSDMVMGCNTGMTELITKANGSSTKLRDKELFGMLKEMFTKGNSKTIWPMGMESTHI